jgi:Flp pilus assembly protein TadG
MRRPRPHDQRARAGAVAVEFALTFPLLMAYFFAMVVLIQGHMFKSTADNAAYEGARAGIIAGADADEVRKRAEEVLNTIRTKGAQIKIEPEVILPATPSIQVSVSIPLKNNFWVHVPFVPDNWAAASTITLNRELD